MGVLLTHSQRERRCFYITDLSTHLRSSVHRVLGSASQAARSSAVSVRTPLPSRVALTWSSSILTPVPPGIVVRQSSAPKGCCQFTDVLLTLVGFQEGNI